MQNHLPNQGPGGWLARIAGAVVSIIVMIGLFFVGITVFAAVAGLAIVVFLVVAARVWWLRRQLRQRGQEPKRTSRRDPRSGVTLEGDYDDNSSGKR